MCCWRWAETCIIHQLRLQAYVTTPVVRLIFTLGQNRAMKNGVYYLRSNVLMEPLVDGWYAWAHLIPPATAARNLTERHLRIMESYIETPEAHQAAVRNPAL